MQKKSNSKLKLIKPLNPKQLEQQRITELLLKFTQHPRFPMLGLLKVGSFLKHAKAPLSNLTFAELAENLEGTQELKNKLNSEQIKQLTPVLNNFLEDLAQDFASEAVTETDPEITKLLQPKTSQSKTTKPNFKSSEAEQRLLILVSRIKSDPKYSNAKARKLSEFWPSAGPRAPFEECLTLKQITEVDLESLLRKRSFNAGKLMALIQAVESFLGQDNIAIEPVQMPQVTQFIPKQKQELVTTGKAELNWRQAAKKLNLVERATLHYMNQIYSRCLESDPVWAKILSVIAQSLSLDQFCALLNQEINTVNPELKLNLTKDCPVLALNWQIALKVPDISTEQLLAPFISSELDRDFQEEILLFLLKVFRAEQ